MTRWVVETQASQGGGTGAIMGLASTPIPGSCLVRVVSRENCVAHLFGQGVLSEHFHVMRMGYDGTNRFDRDGARR